MRLIFLVLALLCFVLAAMGVTSRVDFQSAGLAFFVAAFIF